MPFIARRTVQRMLPIMQTDSKYSLGSALWTTLVLTTQQTVLATQQAGKLWRAHHPTLTQQQKQGLAAAKSQTSHRMAACLLPMPYTFRPFTHSTPGFGHAGWKPGDPIPGVDTPAVARVVSSKEDDKPLEERTEAPMFDLILNPEWEDAEEEFSDEDYSE